jgi:2-dehydropantoate 2-reductase
MWNKFLLIASWSGAGAITRVPLGRIRNTPEARELLHRALREICAVAIASGVPLPSDSADRGMSYIDTLPADGTTSMQRDIMAGRPSELEAQVGAVLRLGTSLGVDVSLHQTLYGALLPQERLARESQKA